MLDKHALRYFNIQDFPEYMEEVLYWLMQNVT